MIGRPRRRERRVRGGENDVVQEIDNQSLRIEVVARAEVGEARGAGWRQRDLQKRKRVRRQARDQGDLVAARVHDKFLSVDFGENGGTRGWRPSPNSQ
jgi:hypothetical protein